MGAFLAVFRLAAEGELAVDDRAAQAALGVVVGRLHVVVSCECLEGAPGLGQVARRPAAVFVARAFAGVAGDDRLILAGERVDRAFEFVSVVVCWKTSQAQETRSHRVRPDRAPCERPVGPCRGQGGASPASPRLAAAKSYATSARAGVPTSRSAHPGAQPSRSTAGPAPPAARSAPRAPTTPTPPRRDLAHRPPPPRPAPRPTISTASYVYLPTKLNAYLQQRICRTSSYRPR